MEKNGENIPIGTFAAQVIDANQKELLQIARRLCELLPVGSVATFPITVVGPIADASGKKPVLGQDMVLIVRPACAVGKPYVVEK